MKIKPQNLRNIIKWYYSEDCRKNSREYLNKKSNSFVNKFLGLFKSRKHKRSKGNNNKRWYNNKKSKKINKPRKNLNSKCEIQITKKYQTRKGPPLKANDCKGLTAKGNDKGESNKSSRSFPFISLFHCIFSFSVGDASSTSIPWFRITSYHSSIWLFSKIFFEAICR